MKGSNRGELMKTLRSSDINLMVSATNSAVVRPAIPAAGLSTSAIWGLNVIPSAETAIWGTLAHGGIQRTPSTAIWGTRAFGPVLQQRCAALDSRIGTVN